MPLFAPQLLAAWTSGQWTSLPASPLDGFTIDSRQLQPGQIFVAIATSKRDGHDFVAAAAAAGASAALVSRALPGLSLPQLVVPDTLAAFQAIAREHRRRFTGPVIGISGTAGKTSTKNLLALLLGGPSAGVLATESNHNNHLGVPLTLTRIDPAEHRFAVIEAGVSGPGEMRPLATMIEPDVGLITLVGPAHLEALGDLNGVAREKAALPAAIRANGIAIFPRDCMTYSVFRDIGVRSLVVEPADVLRPAEPPKDRVYFTITQRADETAIALAYGSPPPMVFRLRRVGTGMAQNAVLAICAALWLGIDPTVIQERLTDWQPSPLRGEIRREAGRLCYLDCYNANPVAMADALNTFHEIAPLAEPRLFVIGGMEELGTEGTRYHRELGRRLNLRPEDRVFVMGGEAHQVRLGAVEAGADPDQLEVVDSIEPIATALAAFQGAVFIKGSRRYRLERLLEGAACAAH